MKTVLAFIALCFAIPSAECGITYNEPINLFTNVLFRVLTDAEFEKAKIETIFGGLGSFVLRADTKAGFKQDAIPSNAGIYLDVSTQDPGQVPKFIDSKDVSGEITKRIVKLKSPRPGEIALKITFIYGTKAHKATVVAVGKCIDSIKKASEQD